MRKQKEINEYLNEATDHVWFVRAHGYNDVELEPSILEGKMRALKEVEEKYGLVYKQTNLSDFDYGYWSGIMSALRWVLGNEKDFLDT